MIRYLENSAIDCAKWDALVTDCGSIYAQSWYLDVVHEGWCALVLGDYEAVMPITGGKKFGVNYLFQPFFAQQLGVFSRQDVSSAMLKDFLDAIPKKYRFAEIRLNEKNTFDESIQGVDYHRNVLLDLSCDHETIRANYHNNTRRNLAKAESNGLEMDYEVGLERIIALFRANRGASVGAWGDAEYARLLRLEQALKQHNQAFVAAVNYHETKELLCGALFVMNESRVVFLFSGCSDRGKHLNAMTLLIDDIIGDFSGHPFAFDFEGSDDDNLARFYLGFGGEAVRYPSYTFNNMSAVGNTLLKVWKSRK